MFTSKVIYYNYDKHYKTIYYFALNNFISPFSRYQGKYLIDNFNNIILPFYRGEIKVVNKSINISKKTTNQYTLLDKKNTEGLLEELKKQNINEEIIDKLLKRIVNYVHCDGENIKFKDIQIIDILNVPGNYFPFFHTDIEWNSFEKYNGFQIWILLEEDENIKPRGNMFIMETNEVVPGTIIKINKEDVEMEVNGSGFLIREKIKKYKSLNDLNPSIKYLNANIGEVFIMNQCVYHCSDPIVSKSKRRAINLRVIHNKNSYVDISKKKNNYTTLLKSKHSYVDMGNYYRMYDTRKNLQYKFK